MRLGTEFVVYAADLWQEGEPLATPEWIRAHAFDILAVLRQMLGRDANVRRRIAYTGSCGCASISTQR